MDLFHIVHQYCKAPVALMPKNLHSAFFYLLCMLSGGLFANQSTDSILSRKVFEEYTVELVRYRCVETLGINTREILNPKEPCYNDIYAIYKSDNLIATAPYVANTCGIEFIEYYSKNGFDYVSHCVQINTCTGRIEKLYPPVQNWLKGSVDSITMYPLDSVLEAASFYAPAITVEDYAVLKPQKLSKQHVANVLFMYGNGRPIGHTPITPEKDFLDFQLIVYANGEAHALQLYYDKYYVDGWWYTIDYSIHSTYNVALMLWEKHLASSQSGDK